MAFFPASLTLPDDVTINTYSPQCLGTLATYEGLAGPASANWPTANQVYFVPFRMAASAIVTKMFWGNGAAVAGNYDAGIYDLDGNLLVSTGSQAQTGTTSTQVINVTDTALKRGVYYMALVGDTAGTTSRIHSAGLTAMFGQAWGMLSQSGVTLPLATNCNPATFAKFIGTVYPLFGFQIRRAVGP